MAAPPLTDKEIRLLEALQKRKVSFMIVGLSAAALQGAPVVTQDVDLWFEKLPDEKLSAALRDLGGAYVPPFGLNPPMLAGEGTELFDVATRMDGLRSFKEELKGAIEIKIGPLKVKVLPLARILASKQAANRTKDRLVIPVLLDVLATCAKANKPKKRRSNRCSPSREEGTLSRPKPQ